MFVSEYPFFVTKRRDIDQKLSIITTVHGEGPDDGYDLVVVDCCWGRRGRWLWCTVGTVWLTGIGPWGWKMAGGRDYGKAMESIEKVVSIVVTDP